MAHAKASIWPRLSSFCQNCTRAAQACGLAPSSLWPQTTNGLPGAHIWSSPGSFFQSSVLRVRARVPASRFRVSGFRSSRISPFRGGQSRVGANPKATLNGRCLCFVFITLDPRVDSHKSLGASENKPSTESFHNSAKYLFLNRELYRTEGADGRRGGQAHGAASGRGWHFIAESPK